MTTEAHPLQSASSLSQIAREQRLQVIVRNGLPPFRQTALELTKTLSGELPDLKKAAKLISTDPALSSQVLRMCNSPLLGLHSRVISIDHAATLLGPERLRSLALTSSVADFAGQTLAQSEVNAFWQHSFTTAMLSQFLAKRWRYFEEYQAYIAGLLHDIGQIPEWMLLSEAVGSVQELPLDWVDAPAIEREYFGVDHCQLGGIMARSWGLMPSFLDVLENHHTPELAQRDSVLVRIVATVDNFLMTKTELVPASEGTQFSEGAGQRVAQLGQGLFGEGEWPHVEEALEREYARTLPIASAGLTGLLGGAGSGSASDSDSQRTWKSVVPANPAAATAPQSLSRHADASASSSAQSADRVRGPNAGSPLPSPASRLKRFFSRLFS